MSIFQEEFWTGGMDELSAFCSLTVPTRRQQAVPRFKGGRYIAPTCHCCEDFIHKTSSRDETILAYALFQKSLKWLHKQQETAVFQSRCDSDAKGWEI